MLRPSELAIAAVALLAAAINGGLGYGFSSVTVPAALLVYGARILNPALVLIEVVINSLAIVVNRRSLRAVWPRMPALLLGILPGVIAGSVVLARIDPGLLKLLTFSALLPLLLLQSAGLRRPIRNEKAVALPAGLALGVLYGATTVSGPPLALFFNNQGLTKDEFRAALSIFRLAESACTVVAYLALGMFTAPSLSLAGRFAPSVLIGVPLGYLALRRVAPEPFRRVCMTIDALLVGFGLARTLVERQLVSQPVAYAGLAVVACLEGAIVLSFILGRRARATTVLAEAR
jgi:uncharacterized membrane protein YfcA